MTTARLFGTDGIRGTFGQPPLVRESVISLGRELARSLDSDSPRVLLGGDTRSSTPEICRWLATGLTAGGATYRYVGVLPTPGLAFLAARGDSDCAAVVSASHNPAADNGIKLLDSDGFKWSERREAELECRMPQPGSPQPDSPQPDSTQPDLPLVDALEADSRLAARYIRTLARRVGGPQPLAGLRIAVDAANGAASAIADRLFAELGAEVHGIHQRPDGENINRDCGSTHPGDLRRHTVETGSDLGVAFDGDADRALFVDERGELIDGDQVLYLWATALHQEGALRPATIVATEMSNLGLERALARRGIDIVRCAVGDREVVQTMLEHGLLLGGEQSGHIVHLGLGTTGDGLVTALEIARRVHAADRPLSDLLSSFESYPQILLNVRVPRKPPIDTLPRTSAVADSVRERLGQNGRLLLRYSGTEPLLRIMIEGPDERTVRSLAEEIASAAGSELGEG